MSLGVYWGTLCVGALVARRSKGRVVTLSFEVKVHTSIVYDPQLVGNAIGDETLPLNHNDRVPAPYITINGRVHGPSSDFLRNHCLVRPNPSTAKRIASDLASWIEFLCGECGLFPFEDHRDPTLVATEDHFARYYRLRQYGSATEVLSSEGWTRASSAIKRFYEYAQRTYQHPPPFTIQRFTHHSGFSGTTIARYQPRRRNTGSAGTPLTPEFTELLLMGALRIDRDGRQELYRGADRAHAILSLGLGTGLRRNNLANVTIFEIPPLSVLPITTMRVADRITKGDAGGDTLAFTHRLRSVHDYINGERADTAERTNFKPPEPLDVLDATATTIRYVTRTTGEVSTRRWSDMPDTERRRLVNTDGTSPILFLNVYTGAPLAYSSFQHDLEGARDFVRERINPDFPAHFRLHDLRHTYAVHLAIAILHNVVADTVSAARRDDWSVDRVASAIELVKFSLGHASESSTRLYTQTAHRFLGIPVEQFIGGGF